MKGSLNWIFADGELPPKDDGPLAAHESLMIMNVNDEDAIVKLNFYFEDREPDCGITVKVNARRVKCIRLDKPAGEENYSVPFGQYALELNSNVPVFAVFGRLDTRQSNMSFYTVQGHTY